MNEELCLQWKKHPTINPATGRRIEPGKVTYKKLERECNKIMVKPVTRGHRPRVKSPPRLLKTPPLEEYEVKFSPYEIEPPYPPSPPMNLSTNGFAVKFVSAANAVHFAEFIAEYSLISTPDILNKLRLKPEEGPLSYRRLSLNQRAIALNILKNYNK